MNHQTSHEKVSHTQSIPPPQLDNFSEPKWEERRNEEREKRRELQDENKELEEQVEQIKKENTEQT